MSSAEKPHPLNVAGDFYVVDGCCTACDVPFIEAPDLFAYDGTNHCYVARQPSNVTELNAALRATWTAELQCIRYRGRDRNTIRRLAEMGIAHLCDSRVPTDIGEVFRNHLTFDRIATNTALSEELAECFAASLAGKSNESVTYKFKRTTIAGSQATVRFAWFENHFHTVVFNADAARCHIAIPLPEKPGSRSVALTIHDWVSADSDFSNLCWYSESDWAQSGTSQPTPM